MGYVPPVISWRDDPGLTNFINYKKKFAIFRVKCSDGSIVWWKNYYSVYKIWGRNDTSHYDLENYYHKDFIENITEAEYIVRKLAEKL